MINVDEWVKGLCLEYETNERETSICTQAVIEVNRYLDNCKNKRKLAKTTMRLYENMLFIFIHELMRNWWACCDDDAFSTFYGESFLPEEFCTNREEMAFNEKNLSAYEGIVNRFWSFWKENTRDKKVND